VGRKRQGRAIIWRSLLIAFVTVAAALASVKGIRVGWHLLSIRRRLTTVETVMGHAQAGRFGPKEGAILKDELKGIREDLIELQGELGPLLPLCRYLGWVPYAGGDIQMAPDFLEVGLGLLSAGESALEGLEPLLSSLQRRDSLPTEKLLREIGDALLNARPHLLAARAELDRALSVWKQIDGERLSPYTAHLVTRLDKYLPLVGMGIEGALLAPELLGASRTKRFLILAQNEDELRATGGFISGVGLLQIHEGQILKLSFQDSYTIRTKAQADPPAALEKYMGAQIWLLRDANWSSDFPTAARVAADIYERDQGISLDGVIAVDQQAICLLLGTLGPVEVQGWDQPVTGENLIPLIREAWTPGEGEELRQWWAHRKDFMGVIAEAVMRRLKTSSDTIEPLALARAIRQALEGKHILLYLEDPLAAEITAKNHWDGAILSTEGDYLMVVDTNVGFNKVNPNVEEAIYYQAHVREDGTVLSHLTLTYHNRSTRHVSECVQEARYDPTYEGMMNRCYWDYLRIYVPNEVQLLGGTRNPLPPGSLRRQMGGEGEDTGEPTLTTGKKKDILGTFFALPPQGSQEIHFTYEQGKKVRSEGEHRRYSLLVQKQPGTSGLPLWVRIELPPSTRWLSASPQPDIVERNVIEYHFRLNATKYLEITFE